MQHPKIWPSLCDHVAELTCFRRTTSRRKAPVHNPTSGSFKNGTSTGAQGLAAAGLLASIGAPTDLKDSEMWQDTLVKRHLPMRVMLTLARSSAPSSSWFCSATRRLHRCPFRWSGMRTPLQAHAASIRTAAATRCASFHKTHPSTFFRAFVPYLGSPSKDEVVYIYLHRSWARTGRQYRI